MVMSISDYAKNHTALLKNSDRINPELYNEYGVKSGLRNKDGSGILAGLTNISQIIAKKNIDGKMEPCRGELWYRDHEINELINGLGDNLGFEKIAYLLIMGVLPDEKELDMFKNVLGSARRLPPSIIML